MAGGRLSGVPMPVQGPPGCDLREVKRLSTFHGCTLMNTKVRMGICVSRVYRPCWLSLVRDLPVTLGGRRWRLRAICNKARLADHVLLKQDQKLYRYGSEGC
jgi:hypothetical protein